MIRLKGRDEHNRVALTVIYFLGWIALGAMLWSGFLIHEAVVSDNAIDSAAVALVGQMVSIATLALGALGAMLSSTSPKPAPPPMVYDPIRDMAVPAPVDVNVTNPPENPVETHPTDTLVDELPAPDVVDVAPEPTKRVSRRA